MSVKLTLVSKPFPQMIHSIFIGIKWVPCGKCAPTKTFTFIIFQVWFLGFPGPVQGSVSFLFVVDEGYENVLLR